MKNSYEQRSEATEAFIQMNNLSQSNDLLNIENQENIVKNYSIICCPNFQFWKANNNSNYTAAGEKGTRKSCLQRLKEMHIALKIIAVLIGIIITLCPFAVHRITAVSTKTTTELMPVEPSDVSILVIPYDISKSYLESGDGSSQISAKINAPKNNYAEATAYALVNGKLHLFGGSYESKKIARLDKCSLNELPTRLNEGRIFSHIALSIENGEKAIICFGINDNTNVLKSCEMFDGTLAVLILAVKRPHVYGGLGLYRNQPATVGGLQRRFSWNFEGLHQKAETLSLTGWTSLPDHPLRIAFHCLVGLENQSMLLLGGHDPETYLSGIWELKDDVWNKIGELVGAKDGSAIYISRSIYFFEQATTTANDVISIERLDFDQEEELQNVKVIGNQPSWNDNWDPVFYETVSDYCI